MPSIQNESFNDRIQASIFSDESSQFFESNSKIFALIHYKDSWLFR